MIAWMDEPEGFIEQWICVKIWLINRRGDERDVDLMIAQTLQQRIRDLLIEYQLELGTARL